MIARLAIAFAGVVLYGVLGPGLLGTSPGAADFATGYGLGGLVAIAIVQRIHQRRLDNELSTTHPQGAPRE